jgi:predicted phosphodiesterase
MTIAVFSDIYANLPALEAMFADMDGRKPDAVYCLGDLVGYNVWPNEVIELIRKRGIPTIAGNYDFRLGYGPEFLQTYNEERADQQLDKVSLSYTSLVLGYEQRKYLCALPAQITVDYRFGERSIRLMLVHNKPGGTTVIPDRTEKESEEELRQIMEAAGSDIMCFGHSARPYHTILEHERRYLHAICTGSAGRPRDGDPRGAYVILTINPYTSMGIKNSLHVELVRFEYDVERAAYAVEGSPLPMEYAAILRTA